MKIDIKTKPEIQKADDLRGSKTDRSYISDLDEIQNQRDLRMKILGTNDHRVYFVEY